jgi:hypothetical protein
MHAPIIVQAVEKHLQKVIFKVLFDIVTSWGLEVLENYDSKRMWAMENLISALELVDIVWLCYYCRQSGVCYRLKTGCLVKIYMNTETRAFHISVCVYPELHIHGSFVLFIIERNSVCLKLLRAHWIFFGGGRNAI